MENSEIQLVRLAVLGSRNVGKTSIIKRWVEGSFSERPSHTKGVDTYEKEILVDDYVCKVILTDTAGQENYGSMTGNYYRKQDGFIVVFSIVEEKSFTAMPGWIEEMFHYCQDCQFAIIGNKYDLLKERTVPISKAQELHGQYSPSVPYKETSAKFDTHLSECFTELTRSILRMKSARVLLNPSTIQLQGESKEKSSCCKGSRIPRAPTSPRPQKTGRKRGSIKERVKTRVHSEAEPEANEVQSYSRQYQTTIGITSLTASQSSPESHKIKCYYGQDFCTMKCEPGIKLQVLRSRLSQKFKVSNFDLKHESIPLSESDGMGRLVPIETDEQLKKAFLEAGSAFLVIHLTLKAVENDESFQADSLVQQVFTIADFWEEPPSPSGSHGSNTRPRSVMTAQDGPLNIDKLSKKYAVSKKWIIDFEELEFVGKPLGRGYFGEVRRAKWRGMDTAVKVITLDSFKEQSDLDLFFQEVATLCKIRHPKILLFLGACISLKHRCIITEYMARGSLYDCLHDPNGFLLGDEKLTNKISMDISLGMNHLHYKKMVHRDLTSKNILIDDQMNAKVADLGLSRKLEDISSDNTIGCLPWMAPEVFQGQSYSAAADVYSFGIILWELKTGEDPCKGMTPLQVANKVATGYRPYLPEACPQEWRDLITTSWAQNPMDRPTFDTILEKIQQLIDVPSLTNSTIKDYQISTQLNQSYLETDVQRSVPHEDSYLANPEFTQSNFQTNDSYLSNPPSQNSDYLPNLRLQPVNSDPQTDFSSYLSSPKPEKPRDKSPEIFIDKVPSFEDEGDLDFAFPVPRQPKSGLTASQDQLSTSTASDDGSTESRSPDPSFDRDDDNPQDFFSDFSDFPGPKKNLSSASQPLFPQTEISFSIPENTRNRNRNQTQSHISRKMEKDSSSEMDNQEEEDLEIDEVTDKMNLSNTVQLPITRVRSPRGPKLAPTKQGSEGAISKNRSEGRERSKRHVPAPTWDANSSRKNNSKQESFGTNRLDGSISPTRWAASNPTLSSSTSRLRFSAFSHSHSQVKKRSNQNQNQNQNQTE